MSSKGKRKGKRQPKPRPKQDAQAVQQVTPHPVRNALKAIGAVLVVAIIIFVGAMWSKIPAEVPTNFDANNNPTSFISKNFLVASPILAAILWVMVAIAATDNRVWRMPFKVHAEQGKKVNSIMNNTMVLLSVELEAVFLMLTISMALSWNPSGYIMMGSLVLIIGTVLVGFLMAYNANGGRGGGGSTGGITTPPGAIGRR